MKKRGKVSKIAGPKGYEKTIKLLLENNIGLQKKLVDLTVSADELTKKLSRLLDLVEKASDEFVGGGKETKLGTTPLANKLDELIRQNRTIARGLILLEKFVREKVGGKEEEFKPLPEFKF